MPLTAAQICTQSRTIAKCPGYTSQSGVALNLTLDDLVLHRDLKVCRKTNTITVSAGTNGPFNLPVDYLRTYDMFYEVNNMPFFLKPATQEFYDGLFKSPSVANYPFLYATDLQPQAQTPVTGIPLLYIYPRSTSSLSITHRYMIKRDGITTPESSSSYPWFQDQDYLIHATAMRLMKLTDDARYADYVIQGDNLLRNHLLMEGDEGPTVREVKLDPWRFRNNKRAKPTKSQPF